MKSVDDVEIKVQLSEALMIKMLKEVKQDNWLKVKGLVEKKDLIICHEFNQIHNDLTEDFDRNLYIEMINYISSTIRIGSKEGPKNYFRVTENDVKEHVGVSDPKPDGSNIPEVLKELDMTPNEPIPGFAMVSKNRPLDDLRRHNEEREEIEREISNHIHFHQQQVDCIQSPNSIFVSDCAPGDFDDDSFDAMQ